MYVLRSFCLNFIAALIAGVTNPIWVAKTRLMLQHSHNKPYNGVVHALWRIGKDEGISGLYKGFIPGLLGISHGAIQFMAYEEMKKGLLIWRNRESVNFNPIELLLMSSSSKVIASTVTYPYQVVRSRLQMLNSNTGILEILRRVYADYGIAGFYKGIVPNTLRVLPASCITFLTYETIAKHLKAYVIH